MTGWRHLPLVVAVLTGGAAAAMAADDTDWPCAQRLVPAISASMIWVGPPVDSVNREASPAIRQMAEELAARRVTLDEAKVQVDAFAGTLADEQKGEQLTLLFARTLEIINRDRTSIIQGIRKYARGERALAEAIAEKNQRLAALPADQVVARDALIAERDWDIRIYDDRRKSLTYLCDQPVVLEQRAFALARAIAGHLE